MKDKWGETEIKTWAKSPRAGQKIAARPWSSGQEVTCRETLKPHPGQGQDKNASFGRNGFITQNFDDILKQKRHSKHLLQNNMITFLSICNIGEKCNYCG